jgi:hypothetical protein
MMYRYLLVLAVFATAARAQFNPQPKEVTDKFFPEVFEIPEVTPGLKKSKGFTTYPELIAFLNDLKVDFPNLVSIEYIGTSKKGLAIPMIRIHNAQLSGEKVRIWMQGGLHGDEPGSTESVLLIIHELLRNPSLAELHRHLDFTAIPMANIDGYLRQRRNNAENLDLNRDQTKLMAHESIALKKAFTKFNPHVALDFHEYRPFRRDFIKMGPAGVAGAYDVMFLYSGNLNVPAALRNHTMQQYLEPTRQKLDSLGLTHFDYVTTTNYFGETHFSRGSINARSSATNYALLNAISTLIEVRGVGIGRTSYKRRVFTAYTIGLTFMQQAVAGKAQTLELLNASLRPDTATITAQRAVYQSQLGVIDLATNERIEIPVTFRDALQSKPKLTRDRPTAYYIDGAYPLLIEKLHALGLIIDTLKTSVEVEVEQYRVVRVAVEGQKFEKMTIQNVEVAVERYQRTFPPGTFKLDTQQPMANILPEILEPEAPNSFISFGLIRVKSNQILPIYRLP